MAGVGEFLQQLTEIHRELVTNTSQFESLRENTKDTLAEFKHLLERLTDKFEAIEKERIKNEAELLAKINALEARLNILSEQAFHIVAKEAAMTVAREEISKLLSGNRETELLNPPSENDEKT
jgi:hypothetical protein